MYNYAWYLIQTCQNIVFVLNVLTKLARITNRKVSAKTTERRTIATNFLIGSKSIVLVSVKF